jgi:hypothetical protein
MDSTNHIIKSATYKNEPVFINKDGGVEAYIPHKIDSHRKAYAASLHLIFKHVADFHSNMIDIISEKYNIPADDIINHIHEDPRFINMVADPVITTLGYFEKEDAEKKIPSTVVVQPTEDSSMNDLTDSIATLNVASSVTDAVPPALKRKKVIRKVVSSNK